MLSRYRPHHPAAARYGVAVLAVALAAALRVAFNAVWGPRQPFTTFYAAVVIAVWYGGVGPGLLAVLLSACAAAFFWFEPLYSLRVATPADWLALALFALVALLVVFITGAMHRARRHAEQARQELAEQGARYRRIVETASEGIWEVDAGLRLTYANWQLAAMLGYTPEEMTGRSAYDFTFAEDRALFERRVEERRRGLTGHHDLRLRRKDGSELWVRSVSTPITGARGEFAGAFSVLTDISRERQVERRLRLLSAAGETLAASLAIEVVLQNLARLCVPEFADQCVVDLLNADGVPELAAVARIDAAREEKLRELRRRYPPNPARPSPLWEAIRENKPILLAELDEAVVEAAFENEEHRALAREMMAKSAVIAPLSVNGRVLGALSLSITDSDRRFNEDDLALAADLARRAAAAVHNALLHRAAEQAEAAAQRHAARLQILDENARLLASAGLSLDRILEAATRRVAELIGDICSIYFIEEDGEHFTPAVIYHRDPEMAEELRQADRARRTRVDESFSARVVETGEALLIPEITPEDALTGVSPKYRDYLRRRPVYGILIAPLKSRGRVTGLLSLTRTSPGRPYTEDDRRLLQELADRTALAVENARLHAGAVEAEERARQQAARMAMLAEVSKAITEAGFDQQALFEAITRRVAEVMGDSCVLRLLSEDRQPLPIKAFWNSDPEKHAQLAELFAAEPPGIIPLYQRIIESGQPLFISQDAAQELRPLMHPAQAAVGEQFGVSAAQFVPLRVSGEVVGVLTCSRSGRPYTAEEQALFQELADRASVAIEKARLFAEVQEANRRKDEFLAMLGHELRNPIAAMLNAHRAATARGGEGTRAQAHEILDRQLSHLARLVDDLLDVSRITRGKVLLRREPVELTGLLRETCEDLREQAERSGLALGLECADEGEPVWVNGDRTRLAQMLTNLVTNAIKFTNEGGRITVRAGRDGDSAHVSVRDTGIGIEPQMLARVFDTFAQADRSLDRSRGGLGLGLALVKGLAELHGGEVAAHSDGVGLGAEFSFRLPLIAPPEAEPEIEWGTRPAFDAAGGGFDGGLGDGWMPAFAPSRLPEAAAPAAAAGPLRVLVIDDNRDSADMACLILQLHGHAAEAVYSGAKGLEAVERVRPDAVCCDIGLPEMDGYEVARELRRRGYAGLLIAVSGYGQEEDKRRSREAGFDAHLVKPVEPEQLARALRETPRLQTYALRRMMRHRWVYSGLLLAACVLAAPSSLSLSSAAAQTAASASLAGRVADEGGGAVAGATVTARSLDTGLTREARTDEAGAFLFAALTPGRYEVEAAASGFAPVRHPLVTLAVGQAAAADFVLKVGGIAEAVTVSDAAPLVEAARTASSQVIEERQVQRLPVAGRNFVNLALVTPKALPASVVASRGYLGDRYRESQFSFSGVRHQFNYQTMDGADAVVSTANAVKSFYSIESVKEFRVVNSLFTVEQGHAIGGLINVVTRSGTGEWRGGVYEFLRNDRLDARDLLTPADFDVFRRNQFGATAGGPLRFDGPRPDKPKSAGPGGGLPREVRQAEGCHACLFFFGNYEGQRQARAPRYAKVYVENVAAINRSLAALGFPAETPNVLLTADVDQFITRADRPLNAANTLAARYNFYDTDNRNDRVGSLGIAGDPLTSLAGRHLRLRDQGLVFNLTTVASPRVVNQASVSLHKHDYTLRPRAGLPQVEIVVVGAFSTGVDALNEFGNDEGKVHLSDNLSYVRGARQLKFGAEYIRADVRHLATPASNAIVPSLAAFLQSEPVIAQARLYGPPPRVGLRLQSVGLYAQHEWRAARGLSLNAGLRYDAELVGGLNAVARQDLNNWQPRAGFAWAMSGDRATVVRGGAGHFVGDRMHAYLLADGFNHSLGFPSFNEAFLRANPFARAYRALPDNNHSAVYSGAAARPALDEFIRAGRITPAPDAPLIIGVSHPATPNPAAWQWGLEVEREVGGGFVASIGYAGLRAAGLPLFFNRNLRPATARLPNGKRDYQATGAGAAAHVYDPRFGLTYIAEPAGRSTYHAGTATVRRSFTSRFGLAANYVFSKAIDNGSTVSTVNSPEDPFDLRRERAVSSEHAKHRLTLSASAEAPERWALVRGFGLHAVAVAQSPRFYNVTAGSDVNRDQNSITDRPDHLGRNTFRGDDYVSVDLRVDRRFRLGERASLLVLGEVFNLLNRVNVTDINTVWGRATLAQPPLPTFNTPRAVGNARQLQLGLKLMF